MRFEYVPLPPPQDINGMPVYVQNELQRIARFLGGLSEVHDGGLYLATAGATMDLTETPQTLVAYDSINAFTEGVECDPDAGTFTFLSASRARLDFSISLSDQGGGTTPTIVGVYLNDVLVPPSFTINFTGSHAHEFTFSLKGVAAAGDVVSIKMSKETGTSTAVFQRLRADIEGKAIDI